MWLDVVISQFQWKTRHILFSSFPAPFSGEISFIWEAENVAQHSTFGSSKPRRTKNYISLPFLARPPILMKPLKFAFRFFFVQNSEQHIVKKRLTYFTSNKSACRSRYTKSKRTHFGKSILEEQLLEAADTFSICCLEPNSYCRPRLSIDTSYAFLLGDL